MNIIKELLRSNFTFGLMIPMALVLLALPFVSMLPTMDFETHNTLIKVHTNTKFIGPHQEREHISQLTNPVLLSFDITEPQYKPIDAFDWAEEMPKLKDQQGLFESEEEHQTRTGARGSTVFEKEPEPELVSECPNTERFKTYCYQFWDVLSAFLAFALIGIFFNFIIFFGLYANTKHVYNIKNMEKRSKALRKKGVPEFIKEYNAKLIDSSARGNMLYESDDIIKNRTVYFITYQDSSTDRPYMKFVPRIHPHTREVIDTADKAQAWALTMSLERYEAMTLEA